MSFDAHGGGTSLELQHSDSKMGDEMETGTALEGCGLDSLETQQRSYLKQRG